MRRSEVTLRGLLAEAGDLSASTLYGADRSVPLQDAARSTGFERREEFRGRSVLVATEDQLTSGLVLIELDGIARRLILCPPGLEEGHLAGIVRQADVGAIVCGEDRSGFAELGVSRVISYCRSTAPAPGDSEPAQQTEWILTTSGTTGAPKLVAHTLSGLVGAIGAVTHSPKPTVWATFYDIRRYGGLQIFLRAMVGGSSMVFSQAGEPLDAHLRRLGACGVTHISGTPSHWRRVLMSPERKSMRPDYVRLSGEIADQAVLDALKEAFKPAGVSHAYASTEAGVAFNVADGLEGFPISLIAASQGSEVEIKIVDGALRIRSDRTARTYVGIADALHDAEGFVDTGDMVEERGGRFHFVGRRGGVINVGGFKVHPEEVESVINTHPAVRMSRVSARKSPITGALVQAEIVVSDANTPENGTIKHEIAALCRASLPPHKVPSRISIVAQLAVTAGGKLARPHG